VSLVSAHPTSPQRTVVAVLDDEAVAQGLSDLRSRLSEVLSAGDARLVVDVSGLDRISSSVVAALLWAKRKCLARGVDVPAGRRWRALLRVDPPAGPARRRR